jgi:hypothetical protein
VCYGAADSIADWSADLLSAQAIDHQFATRAESEFGVPLPHAALNESVTSPNT